MTEKYIARSTHAASRKLGDEVIIMSALDSTLFSLSEVAALIWQAADGNTPLSEIVRRVAEEFEVSPDAAYQDAESFVDELAANGILRISDRPIPPAARGASEAA